MPTSRTKILYGNVVAEKILNDVALDVRNFNGKRNPSIVFVRVGEDGASISYVAKKQQVAKQLGFTSHLKVFDLSVPETELFRYLDVLNQDDAIDGILVQAPLPPHIDFVRVCNSIHPAKDVDGFGSQNLGLLWQDRDCFVPCTPLGIQSLLHYYEIPVKGQHVVIVNRSQIVGKPLAGLLLQKTSLGNATVTVCHSHTKNLREIMHQADILVLARGCPQSVRIEDVNPNSVVIDVSITRVPANNEKGYCLQGDAHKDLYNFVKAITPVPGGVGPLTVACLMKNTFKAFKNRYRE